jgi:hypothetical protein|tara:strand:+ start:1253 stop:1798 length:546 start_codon:yes stop_codon:yes gene_type:complete
MQLFQAINKGALHIESDFFTKEIYNDIFFDLKQVDYTACYQPSPTLYFNRLEAYPTHEYLYNKYNEFIIEKIQFMLGCEIKDFSCFARKLLKSELEKSSQGKTKYGFVHKDETDFAGVIGLDESTNNGTAFYEHEWHRFPNSEIGSYPNRLVMYSGNRYHSTCYDFNLKETIKLVFFCNKA